MGRRKEKAKKREVTWHLGSTRRRMRKRRITKSGLGNGLYSFDAEYLLAGILLPTTNFPIIAQQLPFDSALFFYSLSSLTTYAIPFFSGRDIGTCESRWPASKYNGEPRVTLLASHWKISKSEDGQKQRDGW